MKADKITIEYTSEQYEELQRNLYKSEAAEAVFTGLIFQLDQCQKLILEQYNGIEQFRRKIVSDEIDKMPERIRLLRAQFEDYKQKYSPQKSQEKHNQKDIEDLALLENCYDKLEHYHKMWDSNVVSDSSFNLAVSNALSYLKDFINNH